MDKWHCKENNTTTDHHKCPDYSACIFGVCVVRECQVETGKKPFSPLHRSIQHNLNNNGLPHVKMLIILSYSDLL